VRCRGPGVFVNDRLVLSSERERPTSTNQQLYDSNKNLIVSPRWVLYFKADWPTDRRSQYKTQTQTQGDSFVNEKSVVIQLEDNSEGSSVVELG
jgi:hypothetical protein